jgi:tetratricopeptide (TPR) repeat protein
MPQSFDERRDEAILCSLELDCGRPDSFKAVQQAVDGVLEFAAKPDDQEQLVLLKVHLALQADDVAGAMKLLDEHAQKSSRHWHQKRAECLQRLGRKSEADQQRALAEQFAPTDALSHFLTGVNLMLGRDLNGAVRDFDRLLTLEPEHCSGRFFQAICLLKLNRPGEAKVALTACTGQRPQFVWNHVYRGLAYLRLSEHVAAAQDLQRALEMDVRGNARPHLMQAIGQLHQAIAELPQERQAAFWQETITTEKGPKKISGIAAFQR